jgi:branched-chain amino acid aminotransferase
MTMAATDKSRIDESAPTTKKSLKIWLDGKIVDKADAKVSVYDHGLLYGDGVFEGIRCYNGKIFECDAHVDRLYNSAKSIRLQIPLTKHEMVAAMEETIRANHFTDCYIRVVVTRGVGDLGIDPKKSKKPSVFVITDSIAIYPKEMYEKGIATIVSSYIRNHPNSCSPRIKSLNYLNNILAKLEANDAGVPEAIMLNHDGNVSEATADNVFVIRAGTVFTPGTSDGILEGITRQVIIKVCRKLGIPLLETQIQRHDLYCADEMFLTGSGAEVMPVTMVDKRQIGNGTVGPITKKLLEAFRQYIRES